MNSTRLARGAIWNLLGLLLPLVVALVAIPTLVRHLGAERFGVLSLAWALVGYFTLFDLGIGTAVTQTLSNLRAQGREAEVPAWFWTAVALTCALGALGALALALAAPVLSHEVLRVPDAMKGETQGILFVLAASLPFVTVSAAGAGALTAWQRFGALTAVRLPLGILTFLAPLAVSFATNNLVLVGLALAASRALGAIAYLGLCARVIPGVAARPRLRREAIRPLLGFGGWMTVSAIAGPFMISLDRFLIGSLLSLAMVAYYTTPYDMTNRILIFSYSIVGVLFPAIASEFEQDPARVRLMLVWGVRCVAALVFPITFLLAVFAHEGMQLWLGEEFARHGAPVLRWIAAGVFINALAQIALSIIQASGRPRWSALLHAIELPVYVVLLVVLVRARGIEGAAMAWFVRVLVDAVALFVLAARRLPAAEGAVRSAGSTALAALLAIGVGCAIPSAPARLGFAAVVLSAVAWTAHRYIYLPGRPLWAKLLRGGAAASA